ncbi:THS1 [Candida metapsilosis]|uniref:threonine--tRNA ligase n=1 Tax=Candida metapsilosis TaxID=273372 RepID=A0A8H7ZJN9_9ASCO|nr:THS1 [Candida metapsilosis]
MSDVADKVEKLSVKDNKGQNKKKEKKQSQESSSPLYLDPQPAFLEERIKLFEELKAKYDAEIAAKEKKPIKITLKDGSVKEGTSYETSPMDIANSIGKSFAERQVISKVNGKLWDMPRPLEEDVTLEFLDFEHPEGKAVFWHSSAHILGESCECHYGCHLSHGPPTDDGFFYDMSINDGTTFVNQADFGSLETIATKAIKEKQKFERLEMTKEDLLKMFSYNKYKVQFISDKIPDGTSTTVYRCGPLIDLCVGPHIPHSGRIKAFKVLKNSSSYFLGDAKNDSLQRVYGISFPDKKLMTAHLQFLKEASERDHRKIGREQELFYFSDVSPGSAIWLPHGTRIYNTLVETLRYEYRKRGYEEVITPNMFSTKLWETSGHWQNYKENMFSFEVEKETYGLKPMNCLSEDMRIQTDKGFKFLSEIESNWKDVNFATYDPESKSIKYAKASNFIVKDSANHKMVEFANYDIAQSDDGVSLLVTEDHDMYVQQNGGEFSKVPARELLQKEAEFGFLAVDESSSFTKTSLNSKTEIKAVGDYNGRVWCVTVPTGLIIAHRVHRGADGNVIRSSKPIVIGNCPGHCILFKSRERSYRELPWRVADFGVLHRNEFSGALSGLTRVRRFQQDDAHIFCTPDQIGTEIAGVFDLLKKMYDIFGFEFKMELSTRPEKYVGDIETWNAAEKKLEGALDEFLGKGKWELNPGDGAFYGPKIDIMISDALRRWFQCATIQLDFQLPSRFELEYRSESNSATERPVMIHRAILGSVERMTAILTEHYKGKWPFWLSPRQILIVPVSPKYYDYAEKLKKIFNDEHFFYCDVDVSGNTLPKKVRSGQLMQYNFIFIVGAEEEENYGVNIRNRDIPEEQGKNPMVSVDSVIQSMLKLREEKRSDNKL